MTLCVSTASASVEPSLGAFSAPDKSDPRRQCLVSSVSASLMRSPRKSARERDQPTITCDRVLYSTPTNDHQVRLVSYVLTVVAAIETA
jgi:hypothetical protein